MQISWFLHPFKVKVCEMIKWKHDALFVLKHLNIFIITILHTVFTIFHSAHWRFIFREDIFDLTQNYFDTKNILFLFLSRKYFHSNWSFLDLWSNYFPDFFTVDIFIPDVFIWWHIHPWCFHLVTYSSLMMSDSNMKKILSSKISFYSPITAWSRTLFCE